MTTARDESERSLWRNRDYLLLWCGQAISDIGGSVSELAFPLLTLSVTGSPALAGIVAALRTLPAVFVSLLAGALVDRWNRKLVMLACDVGRLLNMASIPLALALGHLGIAILCITSLMEGTLAIFFDLARAASLNQVVDREQVSAAVALDEVMEGTTSLGGPSLGGLLFTLDRALPFLADAISYVVSVVSLLLIKAPFQGERKKTRPHLYADVRDGIHWMWRHPFIRSMTLYMGASALSLSGSSLVIIVLARQRGATPLLIGCIFALGGIGSIAGSLLAPLCERRLTVGQSILVCRWMFALLWPLYALMPHPLLMGVIECGIGLADPIEDVPYFSYRLLCIPEELRGRVISACRLFPG
ncbi:MAG TPA: MFS transporter, partial [Ktedonobacteraceae bacterium]